MSPETNPAGHDTEGSEASASDFVALTSRFTSGWPWPESSWGLEAMYGPDGWCERCGVPKRPQIAGVVLQGSKFPTSNFWMPNWQYDALCIRESTARDIVRDFRLQTLPVNTPRSSDTGVLQIVPAVAPAPWFDAKLLATAVNERHGGTGARCDGCGTWRWLPLSSNEMPPAALGDEALASDFVASAEWFGDGMKAMRELRFSRRLAEALVPLNPRVWSVVEVATAKPRGGPSEARTPGLGLGKWRPRRGRTTQEG